MEKFGLTVNLVGVAFSRDGGVDVVLSGVKVFSATKARERESLGEHVTSWIRENPDLEIVDKIVTQSSDSEFHCLTITIFYRPTSVAA